ncbi:MAG: tellurite resistance TerB family protein [Alphaproteobacteria bacterium]
MSSLNPHSALVYTMVIASAVDADMTDSELLRIGQLIDRMPVFEDYEPDNLTTDAEACAALLAGESGADGVIDRIKESLPVRLRETAYAFACEIVAADGHASQEELQLLEVLSYDLEIDPLAAAAIQRGARARHARM